MDFTCAEFRTIPQIPQIPRNSGQCRATEFRLKTLHLICSCFVIRELTLKQDNVSYYYLEQRFSGGKEIGKLPILKIYYTNIFYTKKSVKYMLEVDRRGKRAVYM